ncbi:MAG TPA: hypothetical protein VFM82_09740, partial [Flavobacteriaceae bacterium]|nr:hypothetical protein [Flavobacteriaceae bacterium]
MKNLLLTSLVLFYCLSAFSQQLPLKIVNNSSSPVPVVLYFYGDGPWSPGGNECDECHTSFSTDIFTVPAGNSILLDAYTDFNSSSAQAPITPGVFPATIYIHGGSTCSTTPCTGTQAGAICALF